MYDHTLYKQVQIRRSDMRPHIKWAVSLVILHMITSIFLLALCGYIWVNILTLSPRGEEGGLRKKCKIKRVVTFRGGLRVDCKKSIKKKRVGALRGGWRVDFGKKVEN